MNDDQEIQTAYDKYLKADEDFWNAYDVARDKFFFELFTNESSD